MKTDTQICVSVLPSAAIFVLAVLVLVLVLIVVLVLVLILIVVLVLILILVLVLILVHFWNPPLLYLRARRYASIPNLLGFILGTEKKTCQQSTDNGHSNASGACF